ncbi:MAG TPA: CheR family methyltransferase [Nitrospiria bacterium]|jgi:chemotaxis protein methyltransferase CheR|nr:CheR family methyltransferase [Nitrospiria bacterium]
MMLENKSLELPDDVFHLFRDLMYEQSGVVLDERAKYFVENRLMHSVQQLHLDSFRDYYFYLKYDRKKNEELANVIDLLTIHETYFFREDQQLKSFSEEILPELIAKKGKSRSLRIWSAGCSTGEEPYTVSMLLLEKEELKDWTIEIFATDISQRVLQSARRGLYQPTAFRSTDPKYVSKYFTKEESAFRITDAVKRNVIFLHLNLMDTNKIAFINPMDIIFCRNVIIYFDLVSKRKVINLFHAKLKDNGYLLLGHSESLINISTAFALRHLKHDMVYQKLERTSGTSG